MQTTGFLNYPNQVHLDWKAKKFKCLCEVENHRKGTIVLLDLSHLWQGIINTMLFTVDYVQVNAIDTS